MSCMKAMVTLLPVFCFTMLGCGESGNIPAGSAPPPPPQGEPAQARTYDYTHKVLDTGKRRQSRKWAVAILRFGDTSQVQGVPWGAASQPGQSGQVNVSVKVGAEEPGEPSQTPPEMSKRAREVLKHQLIESEAFTVVERERILEIIREVNFGKTKYADPGSAPDEGELVCVRYLIEGSLGINEDKTLKNNLDKEKSYKDGAEPPPGMWDNVFKPGKVNRDKTMMALQKMQEERSKNAARSRARIACYLSVYDVHTGQVATTVMGLGANGLEAISDAVEELVDSLQKQESDIYVAAVTAGKVYLDVGSGGGLKAGQRLQIVRNGEAIRDRDGQIIGYDQTEVGEVEIAEARPTMSVANVVQGEDKIARGDLARPAKH